MAVELATAYVNILPSARGISKGLANELETPLRNAGRSAGEKASGEFGKRFNLGLGRIARIASGVLIAQGVRGAVRGITHELGDFIAQAQESAKVSRLTG